MKNAELIALAEKTAKGILADKWGKIKPKHLLRLSVLVKEEMTLLIMLRMVAETKSEDEFSPENMISHEPKKV